MLLLAPYGRSAAMIQEKSLIRWAQFAYTMYTCMSTCKDRLQVHLPTLHVSVGKTSQKLHKYRYLYTAPAKP